MACQEGIRCLQNLLARQDCSTVSRNSSGSTLLQDLLAWPGILPARQHRTDDVRTTLALLNYCQGNGLTYLAELLAQRLAEGEYINYLAAFSSLLTLSAKIPVSVDT